MFGVGRRGRFVVGAIALGGCTGGWGFGPYQRFGYRHLGRQVPNVVDAR